MILVQVITGMLLLAEGNHATRLLFEKNKGQAPADVHYLTRTDAYELDLKRAELVFHFGAHALRIRFGGELDKLVPQGHARLDQLVRYIGSDDQEQKKEIATFASVKYESLYPRIDLQCYGRSARLECDFVVYAGGNPSQIQALIDGAERISVDETGAILIEIGGDSIHVRKPVAYQSIHGERQPVDVSYAINEGNQIRFAVSDYNRSFPLIIDPH